MSNGCVQPGFWGKGLIDWIRNQSNGKLEPYPCDLSGELNNPKKLSTLKLWLHSLERQGRFGLLALSHDSSSPISHLFGGNAVILRTSMQSSLTYENEWAMPVFVGGLEFEKFLPLAKSKNPKIGFVGHSKPNLHHQLITEKELSTRNKYGYSQASGDEVLRTPVNIGIIIRSKAIKVLKADPHIDGSFIERDSYFHLDQMLGAKERTEYLHNLESNPYALCVRGSGNYSIRLFEAMAQGRIPVIVKTDMNFPLEKQLNWNGVSLQIEVKDIDSLGDKIIDFHNSLLPDEFIAFQQAVRNFWESNLRPDQYLEKVFPEIMRAIQNEKN